MKPIPVFLQIPKTGGTTMAAAMRRSVGAERFLQVKILEDGPLTLDSDTTEVRAIRSRIAEAGAEVAAIAAMAPFGIHRLLPRPVAYFTLVREPIERCVSLWYFMVRRERPEVAACGRDLDRLLADRLSLSFCDEMTRMLSGSSKPELDDDDLARARQVVEHHIVDLADLAGHDQLLDRIAARFGWTRSWQERLNVAPDKPADLMSPTALARLRSTNDLDLRLYDWLVNSGRLAC